MALKGNAAFLVDGPSGEQVYLCSVPPRIVSTRQIRRRYTEDSLDRRTRNIVTIGAPVYEVTMRARFADRPADLLALLDAAANGYPITYIHDLSQPDGYAFALIHGDDAIQATPDPDRFAFAEYDTTLTLRSATPFTPLLDSRDVLFRYHAGGAFHGTFTRASQAWRVDRGGVLESVASDVLRTEWLDLDGDGVREVPTTLVERGTTNKVAWTIGYGSTGTAGWTLHASSPTEATLTAVDDAAELARAGLSGIDGYVLKLDNSGGATDARVDSTATATGNTAPHTLSAYVRGTGQMRLRLTGMVTPEPAWVDAPTIYTRIVSTQTPNADSSLFSVRARPGSVVYFVLAQMEEGAAASSVVPNPTASAISRDTDEVSLAHSAGLVTMALYTRHVERGTVLLSGFPRLWQLGEGSAGTIRVTASGTYRVTLQPTSGSAVGANLSTAPALDQVVELLTLIEVANGEVRGRIFQSLDGGPVEDSGWSSTIAADFDPQTLYLGAASGGQSAGLAAFRDALILRGSSWSLSDVRRLLP